MAGALHAVAHHVLRCSLPQTQTDAPSHTVFQHDDGAIPTALLHSVCYKPLTQVLLLPQHAITRHASTVVCHP